MGQRFTLPFLAVCAALLPALLLGAPRARAYQHVANGGFEQGLTGWTPAPGTDVAVAGAGEVAPSEGSSSARIDLDGTNTILRYRIVGALAAGPYTLSLAARSPSVGVGVSIILQPDDTGTQHFDAATATVSAEWKQIAGAVTLGHAAGASVVVLASGTAGAVVYIDDVRLDGAAPVALTSTASPTTVSLLTVGANATTSAGVMSPTPLPSETPTPLVDAIGPALRNPGFEDLDADGAPFAWEKYGGVLSSDARSLGGSRSARLDSSTASTKWLHQAVIVQPNAWYEFAAWVLRNDSAVASAFLRVSWYASTDASGAAIGTADATARLDTPAPAYRYLTTGAIVAPAEARSARLRIMLAPVSGAAAWILVDDAAFFVASAPSIHPSPAATAPAIVRVITEASTSGSKRAQPPGEPRASGAPPAAEPVPARGAGKIVINEVLYDAESVPDADAEWVELYNASDAPVDIGGWSLRDGAGVEPVPPLTVAAGGYAIVAASAAFRDAYPDATAPVAVLGGRIGNALGNDGDRLYLIDAAGVIVDAVSWGDDATVLEPAVDDVPSGHSIERLVAGVDSDHAADFADNEHPSPGTAFEAARGKPKPRTSDESTSVEVLAGSGARNWGWLPWALLAASAAACTGTLGWRAASAVRERMQQS